MASLTLLVLFEHESSIVNPLELGIIRAGWAVSLDVGAESGKGDYQESSCSADMDTIHVVSW